MKRLISVVLVLVLVLSVGTLAFADNKTANITKSPTDEVRYVGDTAIFKSAATGYDKLTWNFESPDKKAVTVEEFKTRFPYAVVEGENTTTLTVKNLSTDMNGWAVYCTFFNGETEVSTTLAFLYVTVYTAPATPAPKPTTTTTTTTYYTYYVPVYDEYEYVYVDDDDDDVVMNSAPTPRRIPTPMITTSTTAKEPGKTTTAPSPRRTPMPTILTIFCLMTNLVPSRRLIRMLSKLTEN